jgi:hypothetical protein
VPRDTGADAPRDGSTIVRSGPITGYLVKQYDVVRGRFSLHVGGERVKGGLSQKIPWWVREGSGAGPEIVLTGTRLSPLPAQTFRQVFRAAMSPTDVYPSNIEPPSAGCWRLTMRTGRITVRFVALVRD